MKRRPKQVCWFVVLTALLLQLGCTATTYEIRKCDPITVDGNIDTNEWRTAVEAMPIQLTRDAGGQKTTIRAVYDQEQLYVGVECSDSSITERQDDFWKNDSIQVRITRGIVETEDSCRLAISIIPQGLFAARFHQGKTPPMREFIDVTVPLEAKHYKVACLVGNGKWSAELAISWAAIAPSNVPPRDFSLFVERRNINGDKIEVADWPYDNKVNFLFGMTSEKTKPQPSAGGDGKPAPQP